MEPCPKRPRLISATDDILASQPVNEDKERVHQEKHFFAEFIDTLVRRRDFAALKANHPELADCSEDLIRSNTDRAWQHIQLCCARPAEAFTNEKFRRVLDVLKTPPHWNPYPGADRIETNFLEAFQYPLQEADQWLDDFIHSIDTSIKQRKNIASLCLARFSGKSRILKETLNQVIGFYFNFDHRNTTYPWSIPHITEKFINVYLMQCPIPMYRGLLYTLREWLDSHSFSNYLEMVASWNIYQASSPYYEHVERVIDEYASVAEVNKVIRFYENVESEGDLLRKDFERTISMLRQWNDGSTKKPASLDLLFVFDEARHMTKIIGGNEFLWRGFKEVLEPLKDQPSVFIIIEGSWGPQLYGRTPHAHHHNLNPHTDICLDHPIHKQFPAQSVALCPKVPMDVWPACKVLEHKLRDILTPQYLSLFGRPAWSVLYTNNKSSPGEMEREITDWLQCSSYWKGTKSLCVVEVTYILWRISAPIKKVKENSLLLSQKLLMCESASEDFETLNMAQTQEPLVSAVAKSTMPSWERVFKDLWFGRRWFTGILDIAIPGQLFLLVALDGIRSKLHSGSSYVSLYDKCLPIEVDQFFKQLLSKKGLETLASETTWPTKRKASNLRKTFEQKIVRVISFFDFKRSEGVTCEFLLGLFNRAVGSFHDSQVDLPMVSLHADLSGPDAILDFHLTAACMSYMTVKFVYFVKAVDLRKYIEIAEEVISAAASSLLPELVVVLDFGLQKDPLMHRVQRKNRTINILVLRGISHHPFEQSARSVGEAAEYFNNAIQRCQVTSA